MIHTTRIAPSPTGMFHLGTARTAYFNWLIARSTGGKFILRIDDSDTNRNFEESVKVIDDAMAWLKLDYDIRFRQSSRIPTYQALAGQLMHKKLAKLEYGAVVFSANDVPSVFHDTIAGEIAITSHDRVGIDRLVLMRSNGMPTYHFASVADDMEYGVTWIIRGTDHISNTPKHVALWNALMTLDWIGYQRPLPLFSHVGLITNLSGVKLSKRNDDASLLNYMDNDPDALCNFLLRLGWGPTIDNKTTKTITRDRALSLFLNEGKMRAAPAKMDPALLASLDRKYKAMRKK